MEFDLINNYNLVEEDKTAFLAELKEDIATAAKVPAARIINLDAFKGKYRNAHYLILKC